MSTLEELLKERKVLEISSMRKSGEIDDKIEHAIKNQYECVYLIAVVCLCGYRLISHYSGIH